jgi:hypothetical protein
MTKSICFASAFLNELTTLHAIPFKILPEFWNQFAVKGWDQGVAGN